MNDERLLAAAREFVVGAKWDDDERTYSVFITRYTNVGTVIRNGIVGHLMAWEPFDRAG